MFITKDEEKVEMTEKTFYEECDIIYENVDDIIYYEYTTNLERISVPDYYYNKNYHY